jgi:hypothetical protein
MRGEYTELAYPFCDKRKIETWRIPSVWIEKRTGKSSLGKGKSVKKTSEIWIIKSGCNICGKSAEEVKKELKRKQII